jgi:hypothetical protein
MDGLRKVPVRGQAARRHLPFGVIPLAIGAGPACFSGLALVEQANC